MFKKNHPPSPINFENSAHIKLMTYFPKFFAGFWGFKKQVSKNANNCFLRFAENKSFCWYFWKLSVSYTPKFDRQTAFDYTYLDFSCSKLIFFFFLIINIVISGISFFCLSEDTIVSCGPPGARQLWDSSSVYRAIPGPAILAGELTGRHDGRRWRVGFDVHAVRRIHSACII